MIALAITALAALAAPGDSLPPWVGVDAAARTVTLTLEVTRPAGAACTSN